MTLAVVVSATPLTATCPPLVMVHSLPLASVIAVVEPRLTIVSFGEAVVLLVKEDADIIVLPKP